MSKPRNDLTGRRFGYWYVVKPLELRRHTYYYLCRCVCGKQNEVSYPNLVNGFSQSCGCRGKYTSPEERYIATAWPQLLEPLHKTVGTAAMVTLIKNLTKKVHPSIQHTIEPWRTQ